MRRAIAAGLCVLLVFLAACEMQGASGGVLSPPAKETAKASLPGAPHTTEPPVAIGAAEPPTEMEPPIEIESPTETETPEPAGEPVSEEPIQAEKSAALIAIEAHPAGAEICALIERYWDYRSASFAAALGCSPPEGEPEPNAPPVSARIFEQDAQRTQGLDWIRSEWGIDLQRTDVIYGVTHFLALSDTEVRLQLYEWNSFHWLDTDGEEVESGFGTEHNLQIQLREDGTAFLLRDEYDEWDMSGVNTYEQAEPDAVEAAREELSMANLFVVDEGQGYEAVVEELLTAWGEQCKFTRNLRNQGFSGTGVSEEIVRTRQPA